MNSLIESLKLIELHLKMQITTICTFPVFNPEVIRAEVEAHTSFLVIFLERAPYIRDGELVILKNISTLVKTLLNMTRERYDFHFQIQELAIGLNESGQTTQSNSHLVSNHKFSQNQVEILEQWYQSNSEHPFLNNQSTLELQTRTGLTVTQVKNWVSNKRRKEKTQSVSKELEPFLT
ncbi:uncharacterized protein CANTADRAFT_45507 [Suhomyces tanzawaensis NRRL Y-17324]|uniref:Homeobox domain-containing protein n=1 Tax=Suhomyces tanzawaensis NRRL Y-17324 TaxID=984487 RepID=A0A1E4SQC1_9ASCO|nr:uncharacterized protein CANTADRAFT_45507 [Suhomyces tanzawaensis NRRL Y-17324]ODV81637.1 hypothetical protein CANTADRAFT_45507 [Suhomyces tanzawaensis NRRL Y-17324]